MRWRRYQYLVYLTLVWSLGVIVLGAYTRLTEAGLGCPDWPGCYGFAAVPQTPEQHVQAQATFPHAPLEVEKAWNEMIHRYFAGGLGILILLLNLMAWRHRALPRGLPALLLGLVIFQALLGMWTVTMALKPVVVVGHLLGGFTTAGLLLLLAMRVRRRVRGHSGQTTPARNMGGLTWLAALALLVTLTQVALGGWTAANYAAVVCTQLPVCEVDWVQQFDASAFHPVQPPHDSYQYGVLNFEQRVSIHVTHRLGAGITALVLGLLSWKLWLSVRLRGLALMVGGLLALQLTLGITNVVASLPLMVAVGHNLVGALLLLTLVATNYAIFSCRVPLGMGLNMAREG